MAEEENVLAFNMNGPIHLEWDGVQQQLAVRGQMHLSDANQRPFQLNFHGEDAIQALRLFRSLLDRVDEENIEATMPRGLQ